MADKQTQKEENGYNFFRNRLIAILILIQFIFVLPIIAFILGIMVLMDLNNAYRSFYIFLQFIPPPIFNTFLSLSMFILAIILVNFSRKNSLNYYLKKYIQNTVTEGDYGYLDQLSFLYMRLDVLGTFSIIFFLISITIAILVIIIKIILLNFV